MRLRLFSPSSLLLPCLLVVFLTGCKEVVVARYSDGMVEHPTKIDNSPFAAIPGHPIPVDRRNQVFFVTAKLPDAKPELSKAIDELTATTRDILAKQGLKTTDQRNQASALLTLTEIHFYTHQADRHPSLRSYPMLVGLYDRGGQEAVNDFLQASVDDPTKEAGVVLLAHPLAFVGHQYEGMVTDKNDPILQHLYVKGVLSDPAHPEAEGVEFGAGASITDNTVFHISPTELFGTAIACLVQCQ